MNIHSTADRMRARRVSLDFSPATAASGHMPFAGHRCQSEIGEEACERRKKAARDQRAAAKEGARHRFY